MPEAFTAELRNYFLPGFQVDSVFKQRQSDEFSDRTSRSNS